MSNTFEHVFPAVRGKQSGQDIFVSLCPLQLAAKLFHFDEETLPESVRRGRVLSSDAVDRIAKQLSANPGKYTLPPLHVSIDGDARFVPLQPEAQIGQLCIPMEARLVVNSGEHVQAAIAKVLRQRPGLSSEHVPVIFQPDPKLRRSEHIYAQLKTFSFRPSASLRLLHSVDDDSARLTRELIEHAIAFRGCVETKHSSLAPRSRMLFTLSAVHQATKALLAGGPEASLQARLDLATRFWDAVDSRLPEWAQARSGDLLPSELRARFIHSHALALQAIGHVGSALLREHPAGWERHLDALKKLDWRRENAKDWEGRAMIGGKVSKATANVVLTGNVIKKLMGLPLLDHERAVEQAHQAGKRRR